jgi:hypothetical protein
MIRLSSGPKIMVKLSSTPYVKKLLKRPERGI